MKFIREEDMYPTIGKYFEDQDYKVIIDSPIGTGIKFDLLKGWTIDVSGVKGNEIVAVEAKNNLGAQTILQAISQAEMYKSACTRVFIAFPQTDLKENQDILKDIQRLCQARGIGLLSVGKICEEIVPAAISAMRVGIFREIVDQFTLKTYEFEGFKEEDFVKYYSDLEGDVVWHKFQLLTTDVERRLAKKGLVLTHRADRSRWWNSFSRKLPKNKRYYQVPHFTLSFWGYEAGIMLELIVREGLYLNNLRRKIRKDPSVFNEIMKKIKNSKFTYEIELMKRIHIGGYETTTASKYVITSEYLDSSNTKKLAELLFEKERGRKIWFWVGCFFHLSEEKSHSSDLVDEIEASTDDLIELYDFASSLS